MKTLTNTSKRNYYPWVVVLMSSVFLFYKYVLQVSPSVMTNELMQHFHVDGAGLGNLTATFFYSYLVAQLLVGPLLDKYSPRLLTALALGVCAGGAMLFANASSLATAELSRGLIGVGAAFATVSYMKMAAVWFKPEKFAFVGGLLATAAMVGSMAGQVPLALLVSHSSWQTSLYDCGFLGLVLAALYYVLVRNKSPSNKTELATEATQTSSLKLSDFVKLLKRKQNWMLLFYSGLAFAPVAVLGGLWGNPFFQESYHLSKSSAASLTSMIFFGLALGGPLFGFLSDKLNKRFEVMLFGLMLSFSSLVFALYYSGLPVAFEATALFLFGLGTGAFMLGFTMGKELNPVSMAASVVALINTGDALFGAFSEPFVGKLLDTFWDGKMLNGARLFSVHDFHVSLALLPVFLVAASVFLFKASRCEKHAEEKLSEYGDLARTNL
ncbi:MAG: MFS transporter [Gammaproteobacteria bacterium]|nr:MFS transporter [Gammaproteobacteria bacterium]MCH9744221.1 MFS transporter [Gammaproteobacteria bacterium]